jgi:hypothetical protein
MPNTSDARVVRKEKHRTYTRTRDLSADELQRLEDMLDLEDMTNAVREYEETGGIEFDADAMKTLGTEEADSGE